MDVQSLREDFPILKKNINGRRLVYLDNAATTQKPTQVISAISDYYKNTNANIHRGIHSLAEEATQKYEAAREKIRRFANAGKDYDVIFTKNTTEALNIIAYGYDTIEKSHGRSEVISSAIEHHANFVPWQQRAKINGHDFKIISVENNGYEDYEKIISNNSAVVSVSALSNVTGEKMNYEPVIAEAKKVGAITVIDAAQLAPHMLLDVEETGADFYAFSAHKMLGPTGLGVLIGKKKLLDEMRPLLYGGEMISEVYNDRTKFKKSPLRFEAGTMPIGQAISLFSAIEYINNIGKAAIKSHSQKLTRTFYDLVSDDKGTRVLSAFANSQKDKLPIFSLHDEKAHSHDISSILDSKGIAIRAGHHCAMPYMLQNKITGTSRASAYIYNTEEEIKKFFDEYKSAVKVFH